MVVLQRSWYIVSSVYLFYVWFAGLGLGTVSLDYKTENLLGITISLYWWPHFVKVKGQGHTLVEVCGGERIHVDAGMLESIVWL